MAFLGGPLKFYDLSHEEKVACLAWHFAKTDPEFADKMALLSRAPVCGSDLMALASLVLPNKKADKSKALSGNDILDKLWDS